MPMSVCVSVCVCVCVLCFFFLVYYVHMQYAHQASFALSVYLTGYYVHKKIILRI